MGADAAVRLQVRRALIFAVCVSRPTNPQTGKERDTPLAGPDDYGPPLVDQWKARAYRQRREDSTPCCGFETEQTSWGNSSVTLGEKAGPVSDHPDDMGSGFGYERDPSRDLLSGRDRPADLLRVHRSALGGIFSYWDHTAGGIIAPTRTTE